MLHKSYTVTTALIGLLFLFHAAQLNAQNPKGAIEKDTLIVGLAGNEPFVFDSGSDTTGIAVDIWEALADKQGWNYKYLRFETVDAALQSLMKNKLDLVVGPISITSQRIEHMSFSQPFYNSSLSIVSRADKLNLWEKIKPFFSFKLLMAVFIFLIILAIVGTLLWLAERKASPEQFPQDPVNGIADGMWLAIVTMSTTGYGDIAPITVAGRIIAGSWMVVSIIFATSMVAGIASTLTLSSLGSSTVSNIEELSKSKAATIAASPSEAFLKESRIKVMKVNNLDEAIAKLEKRDVDAVVYDRPQLLYYLKKVHNDDLYIAKAEYYKQGYGFAFPLNSPLVYEANRALLELAEDQETAEIVRNYLKKDE